MAVQPVPDAEIVLQWCRAGLAGLAAAREEIDALNVYPVPDSDTGTNLYLTLEAAVAAGDAAAKGSAEVGLAEIVDAIARGALLGARGNSGVIVAQMLRGVAEVLTSAGSLSDGSVLADALASAAAQARAAVAEPVEGTILSVASAAAEAAADEAARPGATLPSVALAAARAAHVALDRTPQQLAILRQSGVVDAGGRGLTVLLDAFDTVLTGRRPLPRPRLVGEHAVPSPGAGPAHAGPAHAGPAYAGPAYEVTYLLDADATRVEALRAELGGLGDSLVVIGSGREWNVHIHVDDAGAAVEAGTRAGRAHRIGIAYLGSPGRTTPRMSPAGAGTDTGADAHAAPAADVHRAVVVFAAGAGLSTIFAAAGAVVAGTAAGTRPAAADVLDAIRAAEAPAVIVLPNERAAVPAAEAAAAEARAEGRRVAVIPTHAQVQGLAALAVHEPARSFDADVVAMTTAAAHTRHGAVTVATREAVTMAGVCHAGDVLGVIEGDFAVLGSDLLEVATTVVARMLAAGGELVTIVTGADAPASLADGIAEAVRVAHPEADTVVYAGGQARYPVLLGVE